MRMRDYAILTIVGLIVVVVFIWPMIAGVAASLDASANMIAESTRS